MKYFLVFISLFMATNAQAGFFDKIVEFQRSANNPKHINTHSTGHHNASWYNDRSGRTASGMRVHYGVAHRTLPFGTRVHITNPSNGRSVTAVVTDRGPFVKGRTLDVNQNVARTLGFNGIARLLMQVQ